MAHGFWKHRKSWDYHVCSVCSFEEKNPGNYCPNCGAKMDGGEEVVDDSVTGYMTVQDFIDAVAEGTTVRVEGLDDFEYTIFGVHCGGSQIDEEYRGKRVLWIYPDWSRKTLVLQI